jgi:hypothetical protein
MKNILKKFSIFAVGLLFVAPACTDLDEELYSAVTADNFFQTEEEFISALGQAYSSLSGIGNHSNLWSTNEISSDELLVATKGGDWYDGGVLIQIHDHTFSADNGFFNNMWGFLYGGIGTCNRLIFQFEELKAAGNPDADAFIAELRGVRALYYYWALDGFGNVPLSIDFTDETPPANNANFQAGRQEVFDFVLSELNDIIPVLTTQVGGAAYARFNQAAALALRCKLNLNAEVYTGTARWNEAIADADAVMALGFSLNGAYSDNFAIENSGSPENIFVVAYDKVFNTGFNWAPMTLHYASQGTFKFTFQPWNGYGVVEEFYNSYVDPNQNPGAAAQGPVWVGLNNEDDPAVTGTQDLRLSNFLVGPQYNADGTRTEDPAFEGETAISPDPDGTRLTFTPQSNEYYPNGWRQGGARIGKYDYEIGGTPDLSNDFVIFRLADIMLSKAEAQWKSTGMPSTGPALDIINQIRARAGVDDLTSLDGPLSFQFPDDPVDKSAIHWTEPGYSIPAPVPGGNILNERGREMFAELTRRQDLIRFGVFGETWWEKPASGATQLVFPIPQPQLDASSSLSQNPGY